MDQDALFDETLTDKAIRFQNGLIAVATSSGTEFPNEAYKELRKIFAERGDTKSKLPDFIRRCSDLAQFWSFIKHEKSTYQERRDFIWGAFRPLLEHLEALDKAPGTGPIGEVLEKFNPDNVHGAWQKALDRRSHDPEGAITAARTLLETVCKHILEDEGIPYASDVDLPKLYGLVAEQLNLAPGQHQEGIFKSILGNCQSVVNNLAAIRNKMGDAHGQGRAPVKPKPRHAELAVNLAGSMASFLVSTWKEKKEKDNAKV